MKELQLNTPDRDAQDLAGVLQSAGFKVVSLIDLSKREMEKVCGCGDVRVWVCEGVRMLGCGDTLY